MSQQTINAEIHIRRGTYDELRKVYDPEVVDPNLSQDHPFQVMPGELAIAQDTNTLFFRLDDGQDPDYTKANTTQRLIEMPFQANDLKVSDRNAVTAGWRKLGTPSGSMFCAILTVVAGDGLWRCLVNRSGNAASLLGLSADPNAAVSSLKYVDTADGGEIWANVAGSCTMYAEVVDETTNRGVSSSGWSFDPDFAASQTEPTGVGVNATGLPAQSDTSACHAVLQKADGALVASENEPFEAHGIVRDLNDAVLPGVYQTGIATQNGPYGRFTGSLLVTRSFCLAGQHPGTKIVQLYMNSDAERELWIREGDDIYDVPGGYVWNDWTRIDCDRARLLPAHGWYFVSSADEFLAALADRVNGTAFDGVKNVWLLKGFILTPDLSGILALPLDCDVNVHGEWLNFRARHIYNQDTGIHTIRFFNRYVSFDGLGGDVNVSNVRLLIKRILIAGNSVPDSVLSTGACVYYETNYSAMINNDEGPVHVSMYDPPTSWLLRRWDDTSGGGGGSSTDTAVYCISRAGSNLWSGCEIGPDVGGAAAAPVVFVKNGRIKYIGFSFLHASAGTQIKYSTDNGSTWNYACDVIGPSGTGGEINGGASLNIPVTAGMAVRFQVYGGSFNAAQLSLLVEHS